MGNIFTKGLGKDDQREGLFKRLEIIKERSEDLLNAFSAANIKLVRLLKIRVILIMILGTLFTGFTETSKHLRDSKYREFKRIFKRILQTFKRL